MLNVPISECGKLVGVKVILLLIPSCYELVAPKILEALFILVLGTIVFIKVLTLGTIVFFQVPTLGTVVFIKVPTLGSILFIRVLTLGFNH